eukprot:1692439-Pyramimonas_sp.AAC.1
MVSGCAQAAEDVGLGEGGGAGTAGGKSPLYRNCLSCVQSVVMVLFTLPIARIPREPLRGPGLQVLRRPSPRVSSNDF